MMLNQKRKLKRTVSLVSILVKYGFEELLIRSNIKSLLPSDYNDDGAAQEQLSLSVYERIRMALEELGPTYVKFGQAFSSREDLLPKEMIIELQKLQDKVEVEALDVKERIETELGIDPDDYFESVDPEPFASASISQVYKARLKDGALVVLKIKRTGIREVVASDMLIMKDVAKLLTSYSDLFRKINLNEVLAAFEKSIFQELSFLNELANMEKFARNFKGVKSIHLIKAYPELSNDNILCMEFADGVKITDQEAIVSFGLDPSTIATSGLDLYLVQVLEHGFFHADPHPGNLLVLKNGKIAFIDFGSMGSMVAGEKELLEDFISHFIEQDARRLIAIIKKMAIRFNISDEKRLEKDIHLFFNLLNSTSLQEIDVKEILSRFSAILNENEILMPDHLYLLVRGIVLIEGIGRALIPDLNIIESLKPYIVKIAIRKLSPENLKISGMKLLRTVTEALKTMPDDVHSVISKLNGGELKIIQEIEGLSLIKKLISRLMNRLVVAVLMSGLFIGSAILVMADKAPRFNGVPVLALFGFLASMILGIALVISWMTKDK
ncbi:ubiquinone biosynthesis protein [Pedobacter cryoconitis]|uniref:ABC1 kinase family protein n=1 Tax=Pedobacter cryoconitis TaxID=188932 RepID=UPI00160B429D|nr:AarF/UbiB family protein [Pedobacter cryoconitis]MBB6270151.1 ubiquinone biosynthesis protein [Pedobacter cryoconitis]